jgi:hypothetical protein
MDAVRRRQPGETRAPSLGPRADSSAALRDRPRARLHLQSRFPRPRPHAHCHRLDALFRRPRPQRAPAQAKGPRHPRQQLLSLCLHVPLPRRLGQAGQGPPAGAGR